MLSVILSAIYARKISARLSPTNASAVGYFTNGKRGSVSFQVDFSHT